MIFDSSPSSAAYMHHWPGSALVQVMACHLFGAKPLPEPMLAYCQVDSWEQISVKFESEFYHFIQENALEIVVCQNGSHFVQGQMSQCRSIIYSHGPYIGQFITIMDDTRTNSRFVPSQWETLLQSNAVSHWLDVNLESTLWHCLPRFDLAW